MCAPGVLPLWKAIASIICIAAGAGASGALNMWYDADIDAQMSRTKKRPIPQGKMSPRGRAWLWNTYKSGVHLDAVYCLQYDGRRDIGVHHFLLSGHLYDVAETQHTAKYRHWRRSRGFPADDRLGGCDRRHNAEFHFVVYDYFYLDAAAFLGACSL